MAKKGSIINLLFKEPAVADKAMSKVGDYLIIQVKHDLVSNQAGTKDISRISCISTVTVSVTIGGHKKFNLIATINHSPNWAIIIMISL